MTTRDGVKRIYEGAYRRPIGSDEFKAKYPNLFDLLMRVGKHRKWFLRAIFDLPYDGATMNALDQIAAGFDDLTRQRFAMYSLERLRLSQSHRPEFWSFWLAVTRDDLVVGYKPGGLWLKYFRRQPYGPGNPLSGGVK